MTVMRQFFLVACLAACAASPSEDGSAQACPMPVAMAETGMLGALKAQMCNVTGSMGQSHWYRLSATLPDSPMSYVQLELWDGHGAFSGVAVHTGTFAITGADAAATTCGVCVRGLGDKGGTNATEYFATGGTVEVTAIGGDGAPIAATLTDLSFVEVAPASHLPVGDGCTAALAGTRIAGTVVQVGGTGGGTGGGTSGGTGMCPQTIGD
jgi:hypothetical protein